MESNKKILLQFKSIILITIMILTTFSVYVNANDTYNIEIKKTYLFNEPILDIIEINNEFYDYIIMKNTTSISNPGEPKLPVYESKLLIPQNTKVNEIKIKYNKKIYLGNNYKIEPSSESIPISEIDTAYPPQPNPEVYTSNDLFPSELFEEIGTYSFRGFNILILKLHPVQYIPVTGELFYYDKLTVNVKLDYENNTNSLLRNFEKDRNELIKKIENNDNIFSYTKKPNQILSLDYDYLILTKNKFKNNFRQLKNTYNQQGIKTKIKTLRDISLFPNRVTPEDIRDFIREEYLKNGIEYVLIGGDVDIIPAKNLWVESYNGGYSTSMSSDLYYSCLDGDYNYDDDDKWGEPNDGDNGGDVDLIADVFVGRACIGNNEEADNFVSKTIQYLESGGYNNGTSLFVGEKLMSNPLTWGGDYLDEIVNKSKSNMYITTGIPLNKYIIETLYDRNSIWSISDIISEINNGVRIINHVGHCSFEYMMKIDIYNISLLTNEEPFFIYSQGCFAGDFNFEDCIAEHITVKTNNGAFAGIMNAKEGWAEWGGTNGPSQRFQRQFWDAVFGENITNIAKANQDSKEDNLHLINSPYIRWCYYQLNLFGDPLLMLYNIENNPPNKPSRPSGLLLGRTDKEYNLTTNSTDIDEDLIYYRWDFGDGTFSDWIGPYDQNDNIIISHTWSRVGKYSVKVKARDEHMEESDWSYKLIVRIPFKSINPFYDKIFNILIYLFS